MLGIGSSRMVLKLFPFFFLTPSKINIFSVCKAFPSMSRLSGTIEFQRSMLLAP